MLYTPKHVISVLQPGLYFIQFIHIHGVGHSKKSHSTIDIVIVMKISDLDTVIFFKVSCLAECGYSLQRARALQQHTTLEESHTSPNLDPLG